MNLDDAFLMLLFLELILGSLIVAGIVAAIVRRIERKNWRDKS